MSVTYKSAGGTGTRAERKSTSAALASLLEHLDALGVLLEGVSVNPDGTFSVTLSGAIPRDQIAHLGLAGGG